MSQGKKSGGPGVVGGSFLEEPRAESLGLDEKAWQG